MKQLFKQRTPALVIIALMVGCSQAARWLRQRRKSGEYFQRYVDPDHHRARADGGDPDKIHRSVGRRQSRLYRHGGVAMLNGDLSRPAAGASSCWAPLASVRFWRDQRHSRLKLNIPAIVVTLGTLTIYRGMARALRRRVGQCANQDDGAASRTRHARWFSARRCLAGRRS